MHVGEPAASCKTQYLVCSMMADDVRLGILQMVDLEEINEIIGPLWFK